MHKKLLVLLLITGLMVSVTGCFSISCSIGSIVGRGPVETQTFDFSGFTRVQAATAFEVNIVRSDEFSVSVTTNENIFDYLALERTGDTLYVQLKAGSYTLASLKATITMPDLFSVDVSGASSATVSGFSYSHALTLKASGASSVELADMQSGELELLISGASRITGSINSGNGSFNISGVSTLEISGSGGNLVVTGSSVSSVILREFIAGNISVSYSGATSGSVNANGELDVLLSGASSLRYFGNPTLGDVNVSGGSSINQG
ncbi:MAG: DUF2807 domain-containing protein [Dehalogenimonas sp.]|uniref:DUF2807 domain-containing protein n=1 Tax=Candidatus Dehalogenimonas loeffleri TaxID=3127115 RepID=A0ABZ2J644_9CHLR|nr:DUF2807 domain-containing protein [Dehalogenimonas sp.]